MLIPLGGKNGKGLFTIVDKKNFKKLSTFSWVVSKGYVLAWHKKQKKTIRMHHLIIGKKAGLVVDHKNGDRLDNRLANLRHANLSQNAHNRLKSKKDFCRFKGAYFHPSRTKGGKPRWSSCITIGGKSFFLGRFANELDAARAYNRKAKKMFGKFAKLNKL